MNPYETTRTNDILPAVSHQLLFRRPGTGAGEQRFGPTGIFGNEDQKVITACGLRVVAEN